MAARLRGRIKREIGDRQRARADDRHLAAQDVHKLRKLVYARGAEEAAEARHALFVRAVALAHRAELEDAERATVEAGALLGEKHGRAVEKAHGKGRQRQH